MYIQPLFHFHFFGLGFVRPLGEFTYSLFAICALSALGIALGYRYRWSTIVFLLSFSYIEAMDVAYYLNHYYFIIAVAFLLVFLPAHGLASLDVLQKRVKVMTTGPRFLNDVPRVMLSILYFYAGLAKLNSDWLIDAFPLRIWLPSKYDLPIVGSWVDDIWVAYLFSWFGGIYDLTIWVFLWWRRTRKWAFFFVILFHISTAIFFPPIGLFPYIMIVLSIVFFNDPQQYLFKSLGWIPDRKEESQGRMKWSKYLIVVFLGFQLLIPLRGYLYPGELFWHEQGFRFSWRVMLMEKSGSTLFTIHGDDGKKIIANNSDFLTYTQETQMSTQPDLILQFAHFLGEYYQAQGIENPKVTVVSSVALNGRPAQQLIDPNFDLMTAEDGWANKTWITPLNDTIYGF